MHNVLILASSLYEGGAEHVIAQLANHLDRSLFRVTIAHLKARGGIGDRLAAAGHEVVAVPCAQRGVGQYFSFRHLSRIVRDRGIDLLHTHTTASLTDGALCRLWTRGKVALVHTFHYGNYPRYPRRYLFMEQIAARAANQLVAVGIEQMMTLQSLHGSRRRIAVIHNGADSPTANVDAVWRDRLAADGRVVIGTTAVFTEQKGLDELLQVAAALSREAVPAVFVVTGEGSLQSWLERRRLEMGLEATVLLPGWKPNAGSSMTPLYDVLFQPSRWEAMSVVVLEAMAAARPVVVTNVGENTHVVVEGETGFVVPPRDIDAMAERLRRLVASESLRRRFGDAGRRRFEERYTAEAMVRRYETLYGRVLGPRGDARSRGKDDPRPCTT